MQSFVVLFLCLVLSFGLVQAGVELVVNGNFTGSSTGWLLSSDCHYATVIYPSSFKFQPKYYFYDFSTVNAIGDGANRGTPLTPNGCQVSQVIATSIGSTYQVNILYGVVGYTGLAGYSIGIFRVGETACPLYMNNVSNGTCSYSFVATSTSTVLQGITDWSSFISVGGVSVTANLYSISVQEVSIDDTPAPSGPPVGSELVTNGEFASGTSGWGLSGDCKWGSTTTPSNKYFSYFNAGCFLYNYADSHVIIDQNNNFIPTMPSNCQLLQSVSTKIGSKYKFSIKYRVQMPSSLQIAHYSMGIFRVGSHSCVLFGDGASSTVNRTCSLSFTATQTSILLQGVTDTALTTIQGSTYRIITIYQISLVETTLPDPPAGFLSTPSSPSTANLITNPNFAAGNTGWTRNADCVYTSTMFAAHRFWYIQIYEYYNPNTATYLRTQDNNFFPYIPMNCEISQYVSTVVGATYSFSMSYVIGTVAPNLNSFTGGVFRVGPTSCILRITGNPGTAQTCNVVFVASSNATLLQGVTDVPQLMSGGSDIWPFTGSNVTIISTSLTEIAPPPLVPPPFDPPIDPPVDPPVKPPVEPPVDPPIEIPATLPPSYWKIIYGNLNGTYTVDTPTEVHGDVALTNLEFTEGLARLNVTGCFSTSSIYLTLSQAQLDQILSSDSSSLSSQQLVTASSACPGHFWDRYLQIS
jgi:hypothetical protein